MLERYSGGQRADAMQMAANLFFFWHGSASTTPKALFFRLDIKLKLHCTRRSLKEAFCFISGCVFTHVDTFLHCVCPQQSFIVHVNVIFWALAVIVLCQIIMDTVRPLKSILASVPKSLCKISLYRIYQHLYVTALWSDQIMYPKQWSQRFQHLAGDLSSGKIVLTKASILVWIY